jgi:hypothetical protein
MSKTEALLAHYNTFDRLLNAQDPTSVEIKDKNGFLGFCKIEALEAFLYSIFASEQQFSKAFPDLQISKYSDLYKKEWATNLRFDVIREQIAKTLKDQNHLFLDTSLRSRLIYGNKLLRSDKIIKILTPKSLDLISAISLIQHQGFRRINPTRTIAGKIAHRLYKNSNSYFLRRNEFIINLSLHLPVSNGDKLDNLEISNNKTEIALAESKFSALSEKDEAIFSLLNLYDALIYQKSFSQELLNARIILNRVGETSVRDTQLNLKLKELKKFVDNVFNANLENNNLKLPLNFMKKYKLSKLGNEQSNLSLAPRIFFNLRFY